jgi:diadenylate cyclase
VSVGDGLDVAIVGALNVSPESFYSGSVVTDADRLLRAGEAMAQAGAAWLDVGAMSTAPYLEALIPETEEADRLHWAVSLLTAKLDLPVSADTSRSLAARAALESGARMLNDVTGLAADPGLARLAAEAGAGLVLTAAPAAAPAPGEPVDTVRASLAGSLARARAAGVPDDRVLVDPGIGFFRGGAIAWPEWDCRILAGLSARGARSGRSTARHAGRDRGGRPGRGPRHPGPRRGRDRAGGPDRPGHPAGRDGARLAVWPLLQTFRTRDAIDIVLVAIVLYRVFVMFKETRAVQMLLGLAGLMVASFLSRHFQLFSTSWLLDNFWSFWVLALIVLFQPELRRALTRLGESRLFQGMTLGAREERSHLIDEVIKAADALASKRIGALIVLERSTGLRHYAELGVPLDAVVSADLLVSLFLPYSPLHDGAAFIRGDRVAAAGCFLPLSRNTQLGRNMGTRHRAGLGLAEETDAVVLIVSEESGRISLAVDGQMESPLDQESLRRRLGDLFSLEEAPMVRRAAWWEPAREWLRK